MKNKITFKRMNCYYCVEFYQSSFGSSRPFDGPPCIAYFLPAHASLFFPSPFLFVFHVLIQLCLRAWRGLVQMSDIWLTARKINIQYGDSQSCNRHLHTHDEQGKKFLLNTLFVGPKNNSNKTSRKGRGVKKWGGQSANRGSKLWQVVIRPLGTFIMLLF